MLQKPKISDLSKIQNILNFWTESEEVEKYIVRIKNEINGQTDFNTKFWVIINKGEVVGITGISDPLPKIKDFITQDNPIELKLMYLDDKVRGLGLGKLAILELEKIIKENKYNEILIRSANRYKETAWGFYEKMDYLKVGFVDVDMAVFRKILK